MTAKKLEHKLITYSNMLDALITTHHFKDVLKVGEIDKGRCPLGNKCVCYGINSDVPSKTKVCCIMKFVTIYQKHVQIAYQPLRSIGMELLFKWHTRC